MLQIPRTVMHAFIDFKELLIKPHILHGTLNSSTSNLQINPSLCPFLIEPACFYNVARMVKPRHRRDHKHWNSDKGRHACFPGDDLGESLLSPARIQVVGLLKIHFMSEKGLSSLRAIRYGPYALHMDYCQMLDDASPPFLQDAAQ